MERLTPNMVQGSFDLTGLKPVQNVTFSPRTRECCGIGAVAHCFYPETTKIVFRMQEFRNETGLSSSYIWGFMHGWDGAGQESTYLEEREDYDQGYDDGEAAWKQVKHLA